MIVILAIKDSSASKVCVRNGTEVMMMRENAPGPKARVCRGDGCKFMSLVMRCPYS